MTDVPISAALIPSSEQGGADLFKALAKAQQSLKPVPRSEYNPHFKNWFAPLDAIIAEVNRVFKPNGLCFTQQVATRDDAAGVLVVTSIHHESGQSYSDHGCYMPAGKNTAQAFGAAMTYARRYGLSTLVGIATEDDDGHGASVGRVQKPKAGKPAPVDPLVSKRAALLQRINALELAHRTELGKLFATKGLVWEQMTEAEIKMVDKAVTERELKRTK